MGLKKERERSESVQEIVELFDLMGHTPTKDELKKNVKHYGLSSEESDALYAHYGFEKPQKKHNVIHRVMKASETPEIASERVSEALTHINNLHEGNDTDAFAFFFVKHEGETHQASFKISEIDENVVKRILSLEHVFISVNAFYKRQRLISNAQRFSAVFLDFDGVKDPEAFLDELKVSGRLQGIPPSMAVASGNGIHLYWLLDGCYANGTMSRFVQSIQKELLQRFDEADKQVKDIPRVMRLAGSLNTKDRTNPKEVRLMELDSKPYYRIEELGKLLIPKKKEVKEKRQLTASTSALLPFRKNIRSLQYARIKDIEIYLKSDSPNLKRRQAFFMYQHFIYLVTGNKEKAEDAAAELNASLRNPIDERELKNHTQGAFIQKKHDGEQIEGTEEYKEWLGYKYNNETIISELEISPELQKKMSTLISKDEKSARHRNRMNLRYEPIKKETACAKQSQVARAKALKAIGLSNPKIASEIGVSVATVKRYLKQNLK